MMPGYTPFLNTFNVITNDAMCVEWEYSQFRFRKSRKRRARENVRKNKANWRHKPVKHNIVKIGNTIYCSSRDYQRIIEKFTTNIRQ